MKQIVFVLRNNQIASWVWQRGGLKLAALNGNEWSELTKGYWDEWKDANQLTDGVDAIMLAELPAGFGRLPSWLGSSTKPSSWTLEQLVTLTEDVVFGAKSLVLKQCRVELSIGAAGAEGKKYSFQSNRKFKLPKEPIKPKVIAEPKPEPKPSTVPCADSYGDEKALALKVGDTVKAKVAVVAPARGCYYAKSDLLGDLIKIKMSVLPKEKTFEKGAAVSFKVAAVDANRVTYTLA